MEINDKKVIEQLELILNNLKKAESNTYSCASLTREYICEARGRVETLKLLLK